MSNGHDLVLTHLRRWGEELIDLSRRNRLLYFRHLKVGSLEFEQDAATVLDGLRRRGRVPGWGVYVPSNPAGEENGQLDLRGSHPPPKPSELVVATSMDKDAKQITRSLKTLDSRARAEFQDAGMHVLHLGLGSLHWQDPEGSDTVRSPLYLLPVDLRHDRKTGSWRLVKSDEGEPALNPSLAVALEKHYDIKLPAIEALPPVLDDSTRGAYSAVIEKVRTAVRGTDWVIDDAVVLATFTFLKEVIYRDLRDNEHEIAGHPMIRLLAEGPTGEQASAMDFEPEPEEGLDDRHPPEDLACVLDADATQRTCLIAARAGRSFVMDGPPGTGKSQTITNVIAQLLQDGKTVLFVSEKAAALDVVHNRLADVGLDRFVLELHSHKTARKTVAQELGKALRERPPRRSTIHRH